MVVSEEKQVDELKESLVNKLQDENKELKKQLMEIEEKDTTQQSPFSGYVKEI
jgi:hypothetical protein